MTFVAIAQAVRTHFISETIPIGMKALSALSLVAFLTFLHQLWFLEQPWWAHLIGFILQATSLALFAWTTRASREQRLTLAFDEDEPRFLLRNGPYRFIRHPFYTSYLLFWLGCAIATMSFICAALFSLLGAIYTAAAYAEERKFSRCVLCDEYAQYARVAGLFWPKIKMFAR